MFLQPLIRLMHRTILLFDHEDLARLTNNDEIDFAKCRPLGIGLAPVDAMVDEVMLREFVSQA